MAGKQKAKSKMKGGLRSLDDEVQFGESVSDTNETVIPLPFGGACGIAIRMAQTPESFRALITIRIGTNPELIKFDFGNYGSGPQVRGGGDGGEPECP